ncbi:FAD-binding oxidoreductase [Vulgatibacter sp.]|uniref:FAD-binding oxidoreductase n=1 Tax=Vulgatibacter sp. TaxID=1971226 RepID=UPI003562DF2E
MTNASATPHPNPSDEGAALVATGPVLRPGDAAYDQERAGYNQLVEHHPALIVGATDAADVAAAVGFARTRGLPVAIQATGHGISVPADGAVFINTRRMAGIRIDPEQRTARVEAGVRAGALVQAAAEHGLAPLNGSSPEVGVVSYVLGGGVPLLGRRFGYAADHVRSIEVVTANGRLRRASAHEEPELFWALRGGKGNFGVVVAVELDLVPVARLHGGGLWFGAEAAADVAHAWCDWVAGVPEEMGTSLMMMQLPDLPFIPEPFRGRFVVHVRVAYTGSAEEGARWVEPLRRVAPTLVDDVREMPYREVGSIHAEPTTPVPFLGRNSMLARLDHDAVRALLRVAGPGAGAPCFAELRLFGGALCRPAANPNAMGRRDGAFSLYTGSVVAPGRLDDLRSAHETVHRALEGWGTGGVCLNFLSGPDVTEAELRSAYLPADFARLQAVKRRYDPENLFRINHNIPPEPDTAY